MINYTNKPVVGIDVSADFSYVAILKPDGALYRKVFRIEHDYDSLIIFLEQLKKVEDEFNCKVPVFMESTGIYHLTLFYLLKKHSFEGFVLNPLITNCNKNKDIRKEKSDKKDALNIAKLGKYEDIKASSFFDIPTFVVKSMCRDYYNLTDTRAQYKKKLSCDLRLLLPGYINIFSDICSTTSLAILEKYPSALAIINASKEDVLELLALSRRSLAWCNTVYSKLIKVASDSIAISMLPDFLSSKISNHVSTIKHFDKQISSLVANIKITIESNLIPDSFRTNLRLITTMKGMGFISAVTILSEIGDINNFKKSKQLVAFLGVDPSVSQSGKFKGDKNKMSKRGTRYGRRALYIIALASIRRTSSKGNYINPVLFKYYTENLKGKKKKIAIIAVMHKILKYIFAILREQKEFEIRTPELHQQMFLKNQCKTVA